jgi:Ca2+-binding RTX toxin-like protein
VVLDLDREMTEADTASGGGRNDILEGRGGNDRLSGGGGNDTVIFAVEDDTAQDTDIVTGWGATTGNNDRIEIDVSDIPGGAALVNGALAGRHVRSRADNKAQDADDRVIVRTTDETLWFDQDGSGSAGPLKLADFQDGVRLAGADLWMTGVVWGTDLIEA